MAEKEENETIKKNFHNVKDDFKKLIKDFVNDLLITFPELDDRLDKTLINDDATEEALFKYYNHISTQFPLRFFDILYKNETLFEKKEEPLFLLPNVDFYVLWDCNISDNTRDTIWKYLQLILFMVTKNSNNSDMFGDTAKLFEAINPEELKEKLESTMKDMEGFFDLSNIDGSDISGTKFDKDDLPDPEKFQEHLSGLLDGKIGNLAKEIAEEAANDLDVNVNDAKSTGEVFEKLVKDPTKLMGLVKNIGGKIQYKIKSGELKESELLEEAKEIVEKLKTTPGLKNMMSKMGMGSGANLNVPAMNAHLQQNLKTAKMKERMREKLEKRRADMTNFNVSKNQETNEYVFSTGEEVQKSKKQPVKEKDGNPKKKKKKNKKNKKN
jgi:hypothetical protein